MGDFDRPGRGRRVAAVCALLAVALAAALWWVLPGAAPALPPAGGGAAAMPPPWTASTSVSRPVSPAPDAGQGWLVPAAGAAGPAAVTDLGVPYGYAHDHAGAALAAVNAVVGARYLACTFPDPWAALGFLADPRYADRGGNRSLEAFFTGPVPAVPVGRPAGPTAPAAPADTPAAPSGGARALGVRVTDDPAADTVRAVVLWQRFSLQGEPDAAGRPGYTVVVEPVDLQLAWVDQDWKVSAVSATQPGPAATVLGTVPADYPVPAESWRR